MIIVTGAAGFIGSYLIGALNAKGYKHVVAVDDFSFEQKNKNLVGKQIAERVERAVFFDWLDKKYQHVECIFHLGARTDTTEPSYEIFEQLNVSYSKEVWKRACKYQIPLIYASSAATYGQGTHGFDDEHKRCFDLEPLNPYGISKNEFDKWALTQEEKPFFWAGLKFFNVFGPNEYHKSRMASVVFHAFYQIQNSGTVKLFRSHHKDFADGQQSRDFIYVRDLADVCIFLMETRKSSGIYNLGTGQARSFLDLAHAVFDAMQVPRNIQFIDTPADLQGKYQYFTQANMDKLRFQAQYQQPFTSLEDAVREYVCDYLLPNKYF